MIADPNHLLSNFTSCIDLIFTDQLNLVINSGVHPSLHSNCHYQITYCKFSLIINYPPPYNRQVWEYKKADTTLIKKALSQANWYFLFDKKDVNYQVKILNDTITNVFSNFVPNKILLMTETLHGWMNRLNRKFSGKMVFIEITKIVLRVLLILRYYKMQYQRYQSWSMRRKTITTIN